MLKKWPDLSFAAYFEPFGTVAYGLSTRYLTPVQSNAQALELTRLLLAHRVLWLAISAATVISLCGASASPIAACRIVPPSAGRRAS